MARRNELVWSVRSSYYLAIQACERKWVLSVFGERRYESPVVVHIAGISLHN